MVPGLSQTSFAGPNSFSTKVICYVLICTNTNVKRVLNAHQMKNKAIFSSHSQFSSSIFFPTCHSNKFIHSIGLRCWKSQWAGGNVQARSTNSVTIYHEIVENLTHTDRLFISCAITFCDVGQANERSRMEIFAFCACVEENYQFSFWPMLHLWKKIWRRPSVILQPLLLFAAIDNRYLDDVSQFCYVKPILLLRIRQRKWDGERENWPKKSTEMRECKHK